MSDYISRQAAIDAIDEIEAEVADGYGYQYAKWREYFVEMPSAQPATNNSEIPNSSDTISRQAAIDALIEYGNGRAVFISVGEAVIRIKQLPPIQPKKGRWILDRSGAYCCSECMEPCAGYVMMRPRDKFCKMCGAKMEVTT